MTEDVSRDQEPAELEPSSALHGSIEKRKDLSYYYAHAPRDTGEQAAAMPVHRPIATTAYAPATEATVPIKRFQFLDDGPWAKVYLPMDNLGSITQGNVTATFQPRTFSVLVRGLQKQTLEFSCTKLHGEIDPERSVAKLMKTKILIKLRKVPKPPKDDDEADSGPPDTPPELEVEEANMDADAANAADAQIYSAMADPEATLGKSQGAEGVDGAQQGDATMAGADEAPVAPAGADTAPPQGSDGGTAGEAADAAAPPGEDHEAGATDAPMADATAVPEVDAGGTGEVAAPQPPKEHFTHWYKLRAD